MLIVPSYWNSNRIPLGLFDFPAVPLGSCYIASMLEKEGISSTVFDMNAASVQNEKFENVLKKTSPDIVGISSMTSNFPSAVRVAVNVKRWNPKCVVVMGGVHPTFTYKEILETVPEVDVVVRYEGELTMVDLVKTLATNASLREVNGICYRVNGKVVANPLRVRMSLEELPYPAHHLLKPPIEEYLRQIGPKTLPVITTRGCPFSCIYCSTMAFHGCKYRTRSIANVIGELEFLVEKFDVEHVSFVDDNFTMQKERVFELCEAIRQQGLSIDWGCSSRVDQVSEDLLGIMKRAGCSDIFLGIESASQKVLDLSRKGFTVKQAKDAVKTAEKVGIRTHCSFILGLPGETARSIRNMIAFVEETKPTGRVIPNRLSIFPGTELFERKTEYFSNQPMISDGDLTRTQLEILTSFYKDRFGTTEMFRVTPPILEIE